jgi:hypothetical protein
MTSKSKAVVFLVLFMLASCSSTSAATMSSATTTPDEIAVFYSTTTPFPTELPTLVSTSTPIHYATLEPIQAQERILDLLHNNAGCRLSCWWGIVPGVTPWQIARSILEPIASKIEIVGSENQFIAYAIFDSLPPDLAPAYIENRFTVINGQIQRIYVHGFDGLTHYTLSSFLEFYGKPDEVWIHTYRSYLGTPPPFALILFYQYQGILAYYFSGEGNVVFEEDKIRGCFYSSPSFYLWSPEKLQSLLDVAKMFKFDVVTDKPILSLLDATGMDIDGFYTTFVNTNQKPCLETPVKLWTEP